MRLDAADLALLEIDAPKLGDLAGGIIQALIDRIREDEDIVETAERRSELAMDDAKDALIILKQLRQVLDEHSDLDHNADTKADELEEALDKIAEGRES